MGLFKEQIARISDFRSIVPNWFWHKDALRSLNSNLIQLRNEVCRAQEKSERINQLKICIEQAINQIDVMLQLPSPSIEEQERIKDELFLSCKSLLDYYHNEFEGIHMSSDVDLVYLFSTTNSLIELKEKLEEHGVNFTSIKRFIKWLDSEWKQIPTEKKRVQFDLKTEGFALPTLIVTTEKIGCQLHGIIHGTYAIGWYPNKKFREYIKMTLENEYCKLLQPNGTPVQIFHPGDDVRRVTFLCEEGFPEAFGLPESTQFKDISNLRIKTRQPQGLLNNVDHFILHLSSFVLFQVLALGAYFLSYVQGSEAHLIQRAIRDPHYQFIAVEEDLRSQLPQPFELEKGYILAKRSSARDLLQDTSIATPPERSLYTAREILRYINASWNKDLEALHYVCGTGHLTQIAYFLQNPSYSFDAIEQFRLNNK